MTDLEKRRQAVGERLSGLKIDALIVSSLANVRYLTGYAGSNGLLLITAREAHFFTDPRYAIEAAQKISCKVHIVRGPLIAASAALVKRKKIKKVGFESAWLRYEEYSKLKSELPLGAALQPVGRIVEQQRMIKSPEEIAIIQSSVLANSEAYARTMKQVRLGVRENEIAAELEYQMRLKGAEKPAFETIVAAGARTALPHAQPTSHRLEENELLLVDMGASLNGYSSDMTRMAYLGTPPKRILGIYQAVLEAQLAALSAVRAGVTAGRVDSAARSVLRRHKLDREFVHSTGHGLGLEIHEAPRIGKGDKTRLEAGMAITIEPGAYIDGLGGVRIEDTVVVTANGCEILTPTSKELVHF